MEGDCVADGDNIDSESIDSGEPTPRVDFGELSSCGDWRGDASVGDAKSELVRE